MDFSKPKKAIKFVCVSDTHGQTGHLQLKVPPGDVLIHAGDFSNRGEPEIIAEFNEWLGKQPHPIKIVIAGNHDLTFDVDNYPELAKTFHKDRPDIDAVKTKALLTNCIYLEDSETIVHGYKIYGSPWTPYYHGWGFNLQPGEELEKVRKKIPTDTEILITHGPPYGILDIAKKANAHVGDEELTKILGKTIKPLYHIFGHIHEGYGTEKHGDTTYINASTCTLRYKPTNPPIVFKLPAKRENKEKVEGEKEQKEENQVKESQT